jgi:parvulin-like peptidyl-prolyl isomerase
VIRPLLHFLLIGACLFTAWRWIGNHPDGERGLEEILISAVDVAAIRRRALAESGRLPGPAELEARIEAAVAEEILYREAVALGLAERDGVVRRRLVQNMRFLGGREDEDPEDLYREARSLGMQHSDLVVRRRLVQRMRLSIQEAARSQEPTEAELATYLASHSERYSAPDRVRLSHLFFSSARRGGRARTDSARLLARLGSSGSNAEAGRPLGDAFLAPRDQPLRSRRGLEKLFGPEFAAAAMELEPGSWRGPLRSSHGFHLVWIHQRIPGEPLPLESVRERLRQALLAERGERAVREALAALRSRYRVRVEMETTR